MKKTTTTFFFLALFHISMGQNLKVTTDDFTGDVRKETNLVYLKMLAAYGGARVKFENINDSQYYLTLQCYKSNVFSNQKGDKLLLKLDDGEVMELAAITDDVAYSKGQTWVNFISYPITKNQLQRLQSSNITKYRIHLTEDYLEGDVKKAANKKVQELIGKII